MTLYSLGELFHEIQRTKMCLSGEASTICSSHDLAPIIEKVFGIRKGYDLEKLFVGERKKFCKHGRK